MATKGCCASTSLTSLVQDTSVTYNCYILNDPGTNDFAISVRLTSPGALERPQAECEWLQYVFNGCIKLLLHNMASFTGMHLARLYLVR